MLPPSRRACVLALVIVLAAPLAAAQAPAPPDPTQCNATIGNGCFPDLIVQNPSAQNLDERYETTICAGFVNIGNAPVVTRFRLLLTIDGIETAEAAFDEVYQAGEGASHCWDPIPLPKGSHTYTVRVDSENEVVEQDESNNAHTRTMTVRAAPEVDLRARLTVTPEKVPASRNVIFTVNVTNVGRLTSPSTHVDIWDNGAVRVRLPVAAIAPGASRLATHVIYSDVLPIGQYLAEAAVDPMLAIHEIDETNNHATFSYEILDHPAPDLTVTSVSAVGNLTAHRGIRLDAVVANVGDRIAQRIVVRVLDETNASLGNATRMQLTPGTNATFPFYLSLPAGNHTLRVVADPDGRVVERDETNNQTSITLAIQEIPPELDAPNLVVERLQTPYGDPRPNESVTFGAFVRNVGTNSSNASKLSVVIQSRVVGTATIPALQPNNSFYALVTWGGAPPGSYVVHATVDQEERIREIDESDNTHSLDVYLAAPAPVDEEPPVVTPPTPTPTPEPPAATPTPPTNTTPRTNATPPRLAFSELQFDIRPVAGGVRGTLTAVIRNLNTVPTGGYSLKWSVDGREIKRTLQMGVEGAATATVTTGDIELPPGSHIVTAEIRYLGSTAGTVTREQLYDVAAGSSGIPGFEALFLLGALALGGLLRRRSP